jgi:hypothetical protein
LEREIGRFQMTKVLIWFSFFKCNINVCAL